MGARGIQHTKTLLFFTGSGYASTAVTFANEVGIALFKYDLTGQVFPINRAAEAMYRAVDPTGGPALQATGEPDPTVGSRPPSPDLPQLLARSAAIVPGAPPTKGREPTSQGDVTWFDYRASRFDVTRALSAIHAHGGGRSPHIGDSVVTIAPDWAHAYPGFRSVAARLKSVKAPGEKLLRVHLAIHATATPETVDEVLEGVHEIGSRVSEMLENQLGAPIRCGDPDDL